MAPVGVEFGETLNGYVDVRDHRDRIDYRAGYVRGRNRGSDLRFSLTITVDDIDTYLLDPKLTASASGTVRCAELGGTLTVTQGELNLFVDAGRFEDAREMRYRLFLEADHRVPCTLVGRKIIRNTGLHNVWRDTTTLFVKVLDGRVSERDEGVATVLAVGILRIRVRSFARQLTTFRGTDGTIRRKWRALATFVGRFTGTLRELYLPKRKARAIDSWRPHAIPMFTTDGVDDATITTIPVTTADNLGLTLTRFQRTRDGPCDDVVLLLHGLTTSTDMFIMPEHANLVTHLLDHGFADVWSLDWRGSNRHVYNLSPNGYSLDDVALYDIPAGVAALRQARPDARVHVICHCVGSIAFMMSLASGTVDGITSVISNSVALTPRVPLWSRVKLASAPLVFSWLLRYSHISPRWSYLPGPGVPRGKLLAKAVSLFHRECDEPACHMISFMWGSGRPAAFEHENLSPFTHERLGDLFGGVTLNYYRHISKMVRAGHAVRMDTSDSRYVGLPRNYLERVGQNTLPPVLFVSGRENRIFPGSNEHCRERLNELEGRDRHDFHEFEGYGHQDVFMGKNCEEDTFPVFVEFLRANRP